MKKNYMNRFFRAAVLAGAVLFALQTAPASSAQTIQYVQKQAFAKILADYLDLAPSKIKNCYKDLKGKSTKTFTPSICALQKAKIFTGSKKTNFKPSSKTRWDFAITSLCRAQKWTKSKSFYSCLSYAKKQGFLAGPLPEKIKAQNFITDNDLALLISRIPKQIKQPSPAGPTPPPEAITAPQQESTDSSFSAILPPRKESSMTETPFPEQTIQTDFFANIALSSPVPNHFYLDEVYFIEGDILNSTEKTVFAFLCPSGASCDNSTDFVEDVSGTHFKIPVHFTKTGNFQLGIIPGTSGSSHIANISVLPNPPEQTTIGQAPTNLSSSYDKGKTVFSWNSSGIFARLIFFQGQNRRDYLFRQKMQSYAPKSEDFADFKEGPAGWLVEQDKTDSQIQQINLTIQDFRKIDSEKIQVNTMQETFSSPGHFSFSGKSLSEISKKCAFTLPDGQVKEIEFASSDLPASSNISIEMNLEKTGTYIFEINTPQGGAVINVPVYVGAKIPLLPDYFSLHPSELSKNPIGNLDDARTAMLALINSDRKKHGLDPVSISNELNAIAQAHSQNMVNLNFFGHTNPAGLGPDERRKNAKYPASIRENLGKASTLNLVEAGLMRSPVHRAAIIDPSMTLVGIGIVKNSEGYFIVTQNFSANPVLASDFPAIQNELLAAANDSRIQRGFAVLIEEPALSQIASSWASKMAEEDFFAVTNSEGASLLDIIRNNGIRTSVQVHIVKTSEKEQLREEIIQQNGLADESSKKIGIGLGLDEFGDVFMTTIYTP